MSLLADLGVDLPVLAAPMAGGPGTPEMVVAAATAGSIGFVAAGYKSPAALAAEIAEVRNLTPRFGVNVFAPNPVPVDRQEFRRYASLVAADAERYAVDLEVADPVEDDDHWQDKLDVLLADPVPLVSFTFGLPDRATVAALQRHGTVVVQTVTAPDEAAEAADAGVDALVVQAVVAGGHSGTSHPDRPLADVPIEALVSEIAAGVGLPLFAAGGLVRAEQVAAVVAAGAVAAVVGTALLRSPESGASAVHRAALADPARTTVMTKAFTGRPARGLRNRFIDRHESAAPFGYPALHHLTSPLRRASIAAGDPEAANLWAGTGHLEASEDPVGTVLHRLAGSL